MVHKISLEQSNVLNANRKENYFCDSDEASSYPEEQEFVRKDKTILERRRKNATKKYQVVKKCNLWKKKVETKFKKRIRVLQQLIPNCPNVDNAYVLDEAIEYMKNLQNQLQFILSASAVASRMYISMMQTGLQQQNIMHQFYASSITRDNLFSSFPSFVGNTIQMPQMMNSSSSACFSLSGSFPPFSSTNNWK